MIENLISQLQDKPSLFDANSVTETDRSHAYDAYGLEWGKVTRVRNMDRGSSRSKRQRQLAARLLRARKQGKAQMHRYANRSETDVSLRTCQTIKVQLR